MGRPLPRVAGRGRTRPVLAWPRTKAQMTRQAAGIARAGGGNRGRSEGYEAADAERSTNPGVAAQKTVLADGETRSLTSRCRRGLAVLRGPYNRNICWLDALGREAPAGFGATPHPSRSDDILPLREW